MLRIAFLEDQDVRNDVFRQEFPDAFITKDPNEFLRKIQEEEFDILSLDHDLEFFEYTPYKREVTGADVCKCLPETFPGIVLIHSANPAGAIRMEQICRDKSIPCVRKMFPENVFAIQDHYRILKDES